MDKAARVGTAFLNTVYGERHKAMNIKTATVLEKASAIYSITTVAERACLSELAQEVPDQGFMVEIGCLYGGITAVLALSQPYAAVVTIDDFSWHPDDMPENSVALVMENMDKVGADNVTIIPGDS